MAIKKKKKPASSRPGQRSVQKTAKKATKKVTKKPAKKPAKKVAKKPAKKVAKQRAKKVAKKGRVRAEGVRHEPSVFLLVHLPAAIEPLDRCTRFEEPIDDALGAVGSVVGGGTLQAASGEIESCDVEVEVHDVARALPILRRVLGENGAPKGTVVTRLAADGAFEVLLEL